MLRRQGWPVCRAGGIEVNGEQVFLREESPPPLILMAGGRLLLCRSILEYLIDTEQASVSSTGVCVSPWL